MSKKILKKINLDFARKTQPITVFAKQGDGEARTIIIQPMDNGVPFSANELTAWEYHCKRPDGKPVESENLTVNDDGTLELVLIDDALAVSGLAECDISGINGDGDQLTSQNFLLDIEYTPGMVSNPEEEENKKYVPGKYYTVLVPAADATDLYGWAATQDGGYELMIPDVEWMKESLFIELKSENAALFTEHNIVLHQGNGFLDFSIDSLPEKESTLYIYIPSVVDGGLLNGGDA